MTGSYSLTLMGMRLSQFILGTLINMAIERDVLTSTRVIYLTFAWPFFQTHHPFTLLPSATTLLTVLNAIPLSVSSGGVEGHTC